MSTTPEAPTLSRQILDLDHDATEAFMGYLAGHYVTANTLTREQVATYVSESIAVTK